MLAHIIASCCLIGLNPASISVFQFTIFLLQVSIKLLKTEDIWFVRDSNPGCRIEGADEATGLLVLVHRVKVSSALA